MVLLHNGVLPNNQEQIINQYEKYDDSRHDYNIKCYAIGNYRNLGWGRYKWQLVMKQNTSVVQCTMEENDDLPILGQIVEARNVILPEAEEDISDQFSMWSAKQKQALRNTDIAEKIKANNAKIQSWLDERCNIA